MRNPFKKVIDFFNEFLDHFQEEEEVPEFEVPEKWKGKKPVLETNSISTNQTGKLILKSPIPSTSSIPSKYKIKIPYLRKAKKYLAGILFLVNGFVGLLSLGFQPALGLIFLGNAFILLDYLWKIRRSKKP